MRAYPEVIYVGICAWRLSTDTVWVHTTTERDDYIRKWDRLCRRPSDSLSLSLSSGLSSLFHAYDAHDPLPRPRLLPTVFHDISHVPLPSGSSVALHNPVRETHLATVQFDVTTPHVVYACLGGFVVLVRPPISSCESSPSHAWHQFGMFSLFIREKVGDVCSCGLRPILRTFSALHWRIYLGVPFRGCHWRVRNISLSCRPLISFYSFRSLWSRCI